MIMDYFLLPASPVLSLVVFALLVIVAETILGEGRGKTFKLFLALLGPVCAVLAVSFIHQNFGELGLGTTLPSEAPTWLAEFSKTYHLDQLSLSFFIAISFFALLSLVFVESFASDFSEKSELFSLMLFVAAGMMLLVSAHSLLMVFMGLELMSLPTYILVGMRKNDLRSSEAALKYFLYGSFATVLLVLAIALLYGSFGTLQISQITGILKSQLQTGASGPSVALLCSLGLLLVSIGFKVGLAPFHHWVPDTYQGAPTPITGFMGSAIKLAGFGLALRIFGEMLAPLVIQYRDLLGAVAILTMFVGNLAALRQNDLKRLFAYSSISHAGYLFLGIAALGTEKSSFAPIHYYLIVYGLMFLGAFGILALVESHRKSLDINRLNGLGFEKPLLGFCLLVFVLSAAGIPPTAGFIAKYFIFLEVAAQGKMVWVVLGVLSSLVGVYYYLRVIAHLYMKSPLSPEVAISNTSKAALMGIVACVLGVIYLSLRPSIFGF
jgi:NADH-quinone oxidoreductase subunit N